MEKSCYIFPKYLTVACTLSFVLVAAFFLSQKSLLYPSETSEKGLSKTTTGIVSGSYDLLGLISGLVLPYFINVWNYKTTFCLSYLLYSVLICAFGLTGFAASKVTFIILNGLVLVLMGIVVSFTLSVIIPINFKLFPNQRGNISASIQVLFEIGYIIGPILAALLYSWVGFYLPFVVTGGLGMILAVISALVMFSYQKDSQSEIEKLRVKSDTKNQTPVKPSSASNENKLTIIKICLIPDIQLASFPFIVAAMTTGLSRVFLSPLLTQLLDPSEKELGFYFTITPIAALILAPILGFICRGNVKWVVFLLCPVFGLLGSLSLVYITIFDASKLCTHICAFFALACFGFCNASSFVSRFVVLDDIFYLHSLTDENRDYRALLSSWNLNICNLGGRWIGNAVIGGFIFDLIGYRGVAITQATLYVLACTFSVILHTMIKRKL